MMFPPVMISLRELYGAVVFRQSKPTLAATQASQVVATENADRVGIIFGLIGNNSYAVWPFNQPTSATVTGILVGTSPGNPTYRVSFDADGPIVQHEWYAQAANASPTQICVVEAIIEDWDRVLRLQRNAPLPTRSTRQRSDNRYPAAGVKSIAGWADNISAANQPLYDLIRRKRGGP